MTKKEKQIILNQYEMIYKVNLDGIDKSDSIREIGVILDLLGLNKEKYEVENKVLSTRAGYSNVIAIDTFQMIFDSFYRYGSLVKYNIEEIEEVFEQLKFEMNEDDVRYNTRRINIIKEILNKK